MKNSMEADIRETIRAACPDQPEEKVTAVAAEVAATVTARKDEILDSVMDRIEAATARHRDVDEFNVSAIRAMAAYLEGEREIPSVVRRFEQVSHKLTTMTRRLTVAMVILIAFIVGWSLVRPGLLHWLGIVEIYR